MQVQAFCGDDSDGSPSANHTSSVNSKPRVDRQTFKESSAELTSQTKPLKASESSTNVMENPIVMAGESYRSMGEILSSMDPGPPMPISGLESSAEKPMSKHTGSNAKRSAFWGRSNVRFLYLSA